MEQKQPNAGLSEPVLAEQRSAAGEQAATSSPETGSIKGRDLTHFNDEGRARMVNVSEKPKTKRVAKARCEVVLAPETLEKILEGKMKKGDVLTVAQVAGIMGAKRTSELIPMCHPLFLTGADIHFTIDRENSRIGITAETRTTGETGVEMEALTACATAALTVYDMCKAIQRDIEITGLHLVEKSGGASGDYIRREV